MGLNNIAYLVDRKWLWWCPLTWEVWTVEGRWWLKRVGRMVDQLFPWRLERQRPSGWNSRGAHRHQPRWAERYDDQADCQMSATDDEDSFCSRRYGRPSTSTVFCEEVWCMRDGHHATTPKPPRTHWAIRRRDARHAPDVEVSSLTVGIRRRTSWRMSVGEQWFDAVEPGDRVGDGSWCQRARSAHRRTDRRSAPAGSQMTLVDRSDRKTSGSNERHWRCDDVM